ncbi:haloacid dehalogenase-like hydrolase domain-containing protein 3 [Dermatophagoides farinae]|uniref:Haloacid dehalogenase-like hydrolase domain-containing protein 3 n=1 Tax=Dermatophagoides farinae TaxID=6954 RepID=A0A922IH41_DERFA|nr:haloacid dehalogenase-like hydrolase domain-containing protein 3 [Dermatophagoides farinae]KAH7642754.1 haloacid dehalogenase-like protein hydrolase domain-containing protein [Dermatophagoides farinae]KAH9530129.1 Haloacid dehalogenase-like hydrolase domain-containing protein 3 [Dermatophagoides farinae]
MFKSIRLLSFDITKTLITTSNEIGAEFMKIASKYGLSPKSDDTVARLNESFASNFKRLNQELPNFGLKSNLTSVEWWSRLIQLSFADVGYNETSDRQKLEQASQQLYKYFSRGNLWHLNPDARELLSELRKQKPEITLAVASNFDERLETILRDLDIRHFFNFMFVSRQCGLAKPDPEFFQHILKTVEVGPNEYLHIGDDVENDYFPVKKIRANALIMDPTMEASEITGVDPNDVVPNLKYFQKLILTQQDEKK